MLRNEAERDRRVVVTGRSKAVLPLAIFVALLLTAVLGAAISSAQSSVRAIGMGGTGTATAAGLDAVGWNPANLAIERPGSFSIGLASASVDLSNNSFTLDRYNTFTGATLSRADKDLLLSDIPDGGLLLSADVNASALGFASGPFAVTFQGMAGGSGNLDRDFFDLVLLGNDIDKSFSFDDTDGDAYAVASATLSFARPLATGHAARLSAGFNLRYLQGFYDFSDVEAGGGITTDISGVSGAASASYRTATGGSGYAVDLGLALQAPRGWTFGLALQNGLSSVNWDRDTERHIWSACGDSLSTATHDFDNAVADSDTSYAIGAYSTSLPQQLRLGAGNRIGRLAYAFDIIRDLGERSHSSSRTAINAGCEMALLSWLRPRLGIGVGGPSSARSSVGLGLAFGPCRWDFAVGNRGRIWPDDTRGLAFAAGSSLVF